MIASTLSPCVISDKPLMTVASPVAGDSFNVTLFKNFANGRARLMDQRRYVWNGKVYTTTWSRPRAETRLLATQLGKDFLVQRMNGSESAATYWIARPIFAGAYFVFPVDESALSPCDRLRLCAPDQPEGQCLIRSYYQLREVAWATIKGAMPSTPNLAVLSAEGTN